MASVSEQLLRTLDDLDADKLKRFKWHLKNNYDVSGAALEHADAPDTVDLMIKHFGPDEAVKITVELLRKMDQNHKAEELEKKHKEDSRRLTLDLNTVNTHLGLSESNRAISFTSIYTKQSYPDHPDRFDENIPQVLCRESVCGRCYWEIERSGDVYISVSYKSISRKGGKECVFGRNDQSWSLICFRSRYSFRHDNIQTDLPVESISLKIGLYVDHSAGTLSFYSIYRNKLILIHTVQTTFTQPLYPGFWVGHTGSSVKLC
ncbi:Stonustoxin subunit alpha [Anabarilius grahami]|uniref:Stonustoxin subunit alpha n=1 Tax=Anabarilius grahami TaxID=495550 RepID=A0A3N0YHR1_ANAGA|nr:Stonustoxin subunit alpha [Anabarilius grahami]